MLTVSEHGLSFARSHTHKYKKEWRMYENGMANALKAFSGFEWAKMVRSKW